MRPDHERSNQDRTGRKRISGRLWAAALLEDERVFSLRPETTFRPWHWTVAFLAILLGDYVTGPLLPSAILFYFIPIGMAAWSGARWWSAGLALLWPPLRLGLLALWGIPWPGRITFEDTIINCLVSLAFASLVWHVADRGRKLRLLRGLLPICGFCKRIRSGTEWQAVETYITQHSEAVFTHTFCPECGQKHYGAHLQ